MGGSASAKSFSPTIASLLDYRCPEWFRDAKFGIYLHWGVYSVAERGEWYPRQMYQEGNPVYLHHAATWGHPSEFGYKDFIPLWRAERWDPERLVDLFAKAGAKYFTPCAVHHDNFDLWNSRHHRWNSVEMGPKQDITDRWREATLARGLRFGVTTHAARTWSWFATNKLADSSGPKKGVPYDGNDPELRDFYLDPHPDTDRRHPHNPPESWRRHWAARIKNLIDNYHPDHLYFDGAIPFQGDDHGQTGLDVIAHLYNDSLAQHDGELEAVMCIKKVTAHGAYVDGVATLDIERGRSDEVLADPWQTDTSIGPWGYRAGAKYRSVTELIHELVDIVSKNGNVLLNVPPRADGTLDEETERILADIGEWLGANGEAIYCTRPWTRSAERDVRFTRKGNSVYIISLERPGGGQLNVQSLALGNGIGRIGEVVLLGREGEIRWGQDLDSLRIVVPDDLGGDHAWAFRATFDA
ncbi:MAG: alpha-L-fucosidase [Planctomycetota bacterium]|jgi:alpha-L-fucosidase